MGGRFFERSEVAIRQRAGVSARFLTKIEATKALIVPLKRGFEGFEDTVLKWEGFALPFQYPRADSNRNRQNRNLKSYPLDYGGKSCKVIHFCGESYQYVGKFQ